jgi:hypothetical protein
MVYIEVVVNMFKPCANGVNIPCYKETFNQQFREWYKVREWCDSQGWSLGEDYLAPGYIPNGKWYFNTTDKQILFTLRRS